MSEFWKLTPTFITAGTPAEAQAEADRRFPLIVRSSRLKLWKPGDHLAVKGTCLLVGVATWSQYDLRLLDFMNDSLARQDASDLTVHVFNVAGLSAAELAAMVPGAGPIFHTPVVGMFADGALLNSASGRAGRDLAAGRFGSNSDEIVRFVDDARRAASTE